jgi:hypothetical protein
MNRSRLKTAFWEVAVELCRVNERCRQFAAVTVQIPNLISEEAFIIAIP